MVSHSYVQREITLQIFSPLPTKSKGTLGLHSVRLSVHPSVQQISFPDFFFMLEDIDLIFSVLFYHDKLQVKFDFHDFSFSPRSVKTVSLELNF